MASVALIVVIVALAFRSLGAPLVTLFAAAVAFGITIRVLPWLGDRFGATVPAEVEPIITVLLLGLVTDYSVFFLSETRQRLREGDGRLEATRGAIRRTAPIVLTAGLIVAAGTGALAVGELGFFRAFGPGLAATTLIALVVSITLVPALLALFGPRLFGGDLGTQSAHGPVPHEDTDTHAIERARRDVDAEPDSRLRRAFSRPLTALERTEQLAVEAQTSRWRLLIARIMTARPVALVIAVSCLAFLAILALPAGGMQLGLGFISSLPPGNEVRRAADAASDGLGPGAVSPTEIDLEQPGIAARRQQLARLEEADRPRAGPSRGDRPERAAAAARPADPRHRGRPGRTARGDLRQRPARGHGHRPPPGAARAAARPAASERPRRPARRRGRRDRGRGRDRRRGRERPQADRVRRAGGRTCCC